MTTFPLMLAVIWAVFSAGTADDPSAVAPIETMGEPVAFWWDEQAFHVGKRAFAWADIGVKPVDGCNFSISLGETVDREKIELKGTLKKGAPRYRIGRFGQVGNTNVNTRVEMTAKAKGMVKSYMSAVGATQDYVMVPMSKAVTPGEKVAFDIASPRCSSSGCLHYTLTDVDGTRLYAMSCNYRAQGLLFDWQYVWTDVKATNLVVNTSGWNDDAGCSVRVTARDYTSDTMDAWTKTVRVGTLWGMRDMRIDVADLPPGFYWMHLDYIGGDGKALCSDRRFPYVKPAAKMPWQGETLGAEDTVPPPWTKPGFAEDGTFRCWNREILLGGEGLVRSVKCGGKELLARPVALVLDGRALAFDVRLESCRNSEATYRLKARGADVDVRVKCEFDGFMLFEATYPTSAKSLVWKVSAGRSHVTGFDDCSSEANGNAFFPKGSNPAFSFDPSVKQMWWMPGRIGMMGGILNLHGWHARDLAKAGRVESTADEISVATTFVDEPMPAGPRRTVRFYLEPTPVKPKNTQLAATDETKWTLWTASITKYFESKYPGFDDPVKSKPFKEDIKKGKRVFFYNASAAYAYGDAFWNWYRRDWHRRGYTTFAHEAPNYDPAKRDTGWAYSCLASQDHFDFTMWGLNWFLHEAVPEMKDVYFDLANPGPCQNADHGCAWKDDFGRQMNDWATLQTRELHKRFYRLMKAKNRDGAMYGHVGSRRGPSDVFFDMICAGEGFAHKIHNHEYNYYDIFTPEVMQSFFVPRAQEMVMIVLPQFMRARSCWAPHLNKSYCSTSPENDRAIRHFTAYAKIHDLLIQRSPNAPEGVQFYKVDAPIRRIRAAGGYSAYHLGGKPAVSVSKPDPRFLWAWFADANEAVLVLLNDTDAEVKETVSVKGLSAKGKEMLDGTSFDFSSGSCELTFGPRAAKFISFNLKK